MLTSSYIFILAIPKLSGRESLPHSTCFLGDQEIFEPMGTRYEGIVGNLKDKDHSAELDNNKKRILHCIIFVQEIGIA